MALQPAEAVKVSWLIPVRDGAQWLGGAVRSALAECSPDDEVLVIDDGSRDHPESVLPQDSRVRLLTQAAAGIGVALEHGRLHARGEYLARLDADDEALPGRRASQITELDAHPEVGAVGGAFALRGVDGAEPGEGMRAYQQWLNAVTDPHRELFVECPLLHPAMLLRAAAVASVGGWRHGDFPEDYDLVLRLAEAGWQLRTVPHEVVLVRDHPQRLSRTDPRYAPAAFDELRRAALARTRLASPQRIVLWCGKRAGKDWLRWLQRCGHTVPAVVDIAPSHMRLGVPVIAPEALPAVACDLLLVAVGRRGAHAEIRARIARLQPGWCEGREWFFVR